MVGNRVAEDLFSGTGKNYQQVVGGIGKSIKPDSFSTGKTMTINNRSEYHPEGKGMNVIGVLPGADPVLKDEIILIGGHLDHCGMCWEMCPGANDNASGISVMLGVAKALTQSGFNFKRTLVFIATGAEEQGLIGATKYVEDPVFPLNNTIGFINLDCVGIGPNLHAGGGVSFPGLFGPIENANQNFVHRNLGSSVSGNAGRPRSDAAVFTKAGVPAISFSSYGGSGAYHTPADTPDTIWAETLEDLATILTIALADLAEINKP
jgi:Zn-dependent M28 family amino/carboxypeptidase